MFGRVLNMSLYILAFRQKYFLVKGPFNDCDSQPEEQTNEQILHRYYKYQLLI